MKFTCIVIDDEWHGVNTLNDLIEDHPLLWVKASFMDVIQGIEYLDKEGPVDIIFSDIGMPKMDGLSAAKYYRPLCRYLIYVTGYQHLAEKAMDVQADGVLLKPVFNEEFEQMITKLLPLKSTTK